MHIPQIVGGVLVRFPDILRAMAMPLVVVLVIRLLLFALVGSVPAPTAGREMDEGMMELMNRAAPLLIIEGLIVLWASVMVPVRWHRYVIAGDRGFRWWTIPLGNREWAYFGWLLLHTLIVGAILMIPMMVMGSLLLRPIMMGSQVTMADFIPAVLILVAIGLAAWSLWLAAFGLVLPAAALERRIGGFGGSVQAAKGHYWRFVGRIAIMTVIGTAVGGAVTQAGILFAAWIGGSMPGFVAQGVTNVVGMALGLALSTSALSFNYGEAFGWPAPGSNSPPADAPTNPGPSDAPTVAPDDP